MWYIVRSLEIFNNQVEFVVLAFGGPKYTQAQDC